MLRSSNCSEISTAIAGAHLLTPRRSALLQNQAWPLAPRTAAETHCFHVGVWVKAVCQPHGKCCFSSAYLVLLGEAKLATNTKGALGILNQVLLLRLLYSACTQTDLSVCYFVEAILPPAAASRLCNHSSGKHAAQTSTICM